jgi:hypothetical protein
MKLRITFELDCLPDTRGADVRNIVRLAGSSFERACAPLGECVLQEIRPVDTKEPTLSSAIESALTADGAVRIRPTSEFAGTGPRRR